MKLYFVRHGESTANLLHEFSNSGHKHPLSEKGQAQARAVAGALAGIPFARIYTSPVMRAVQTAQVLSENLQVPLEIAEPLREWSVGIYEGTTDPRGWELHKLVQEQWFDKHEFESRMPGGESLIEIRARFEPFIENLLADRGHPARNLLLVAHGGIYLAMLPIIFKNVNHAFACHHGFPYTACTIAEPRTDGLYCLDWCGIPLNTKQDFS